MYEVKLGDEYLMSSLFTAGEVELARLGLAELPDGPLDVAVGGLGLGYTARTALDDPRVRSLIVVDALAEVIDWHRRGLVPLGAGLASDPGAGWCAGTSSRWLRGARRRPDRCPRTARRWAVRCLLGARPAAPVRLRAVWTPRLPAAVSTRSCWTSTTHRAMCCTPAMPRSTAWPV
ncbi:hypothetical protein SAV31267_093670 [Streptomyces avermitilis]|uniref:Spermidine synthase n=1 Tax=Streptomyces avermitilis TaxID=33903 RepID=A0A4D4N5Q4_STRAX|nr:hypothetical protein SAV31267_093670 [Streptomyces avermitilis]